ncbi:hypothetical protein TrispH2_007217 [Trichoplax sp. H2]|nr:hypothetical protein TrispH2_007217 [Trichoplax sp. H2]|eukprot:RDD40288.1 hypothetical protein TrispH2_007217 [Trichoplax sp. H2]
MTEAPRSLDTAQYMENLKEKEELKKKLAEKEKELVEALVRSYDLQKKLDKLQADKKSAPKLTSKPPKRRAGKKKKGKKDGKEDKTEDISWTTEKFYEEVAEKFPEMTLSTLLAAEKKFMEADKDGNGEIDEKELETILQQSNLLFTKFQIMEIIQSIDVDESSTLDFMECLAVIHALQQNRKTALPQSIQQNKSTICVIQ